MDRHRKIQPLIMLAIGIAVGAVGYHTWLLVNDMVVKPRTEVDAQEALIANLKEENQQLVEDLFRADDAETLVNQTGKLPYDEEADARQVVNQARATALEQNKFLMIVFGANWCMDCRNLHRMLKSEDVLEYSKDKFHFAQVNIGKFNQNLELANELGVSLKRGIPVAIFFDTEGNVIGTTNEGQLEPARRYSSKQILKFVRDIAQRSKIMAPDSVQ